MDGLLFAVRVHARLGSARPRSLLEAEWIDGPLSNIRHALAFRR